MDHSKKIFFLKPRTTKLETEILPDMTVAKWKANIEKTLFEVTYTLPYFLLIMASPLFLELQYMFGTSHS